MNRLSNLRKLLNQSVQKAEVRLECPLCFGLAADAFNFGYCYVLHPDLRQWIAHIIELEWLNNRRG